MGRMSDGNSKPIAKGVTGLYTENVSFVDRTGARRSEVQSVGSITLPNGDKMKFRLTKPGNRKEHKEDLAFWLQCTIWPADDRNGSGNRRMS